MHPITLTIGVILSGAVLFLVMYWWSEGIIEASEAFVLAIILCGLVFGLFVAGSIGQFFLAFIPLSGVAAYAYYSYKIGSSTAYFKRRCDDYRMVIEADPRNLGARQYLAEALYNLGNLDDAIAEMQTAVDMGGGMECQYHLSKWIKQQHLRDTINPVCRWCETENPMGARVCSRCGAELPYDTAFTRWLMGGKAANARKYLLLLIGAAIACISLLTLPFKFALIPIMSYLLTLAGWGLASSARS